MATALAVGQFVQISVENRAEPAGSARFLPLICCRVVISFKSARNLLIPTISYAMFRYDSVESPKALTALKYMLLSKIMLRTPEDVQAIMSGKLAVKYAGLNLDAMRAVAEASHRRSLADFQKAVKQYREQLEDDVIVRAHLGSLYDAMLEQNLCRLVEPYSRVQVLVNMYEMCDTEADDRIKSVWCEWPSV